ncbi:amidohydrolase family protein [Krasilnikoviella flava]|uniref:L-fuconolactonase n=1 Tax=Krasilnikoviella flava TaxID=526729 RepID=A0A1T5LMB8_9MICO|nr:amidohydrolase family protein [Krasilnikoviella flava]SKC76628.1 L-fuconolactonase [Krasilnikoviella flava]
MSAQNARSCTVGGTTGIVDAHVHLWDTAAMRISWFRDDLGLPARVGPDDLRRAAGTSPVPVRAAVAVQAADTEAEARWLAREASVHRPLPGPVVLQYGARPDDPAAWAGTAQALIDDGTPAGVRVAGIRLAVPGGAADLSDVVGLDALCEGLAASGRVLETLVRPAQLPAVAALARRHPDLDVVVCHLGLGTGAPDDAWRDALAALAARPRAHAKVSGLHRAAADHAPPDDAARVAAAVRTAVDLLGPGRLLFGSDWPMSARVAPYAEIVERTARALPALDDDAAAAVWSGTADRLYGSRR